MAANNKIFVSIACYMDKDIINTIEDCLKNAKHPDNVVFGICLQFDPEDTFFEKYENNPQIRIKRMHWKEAKGPMYARYFCTKLVKNEEYFLQIDCHTRFYENWDEIIIEELHKCEKLHNKCVISHYPLNISRMHFPEWQKKIGMIKTFRYINVDSIKSHGSLQKLPSEPVQSYGIMAAMKFMRVKSLLEVPYDINTYHGYHGEEQFYYSVRLWSRGFNCYTPTRHILAMEYGTNRDRLTRESKSHLAQDSALWNQRTWRKCKYYMRLDSLENIDYDGYINDVLENQNIYGLGDERNVIDYFKMAGIHEKLLDLFPFYKSYVNHKFHNKGEFTHLLEIYNPGKKIAIVTQNTPNLIKHYYKEARENHIMYCKKNDYTYYVFYDNLAEDVKRGESPKISWSKVKATLHVVENHDYTMWMDADAIFTNQTIKIEDKINEYPEKDYYLCRDPKQPFVNSGVSIWKNSKDSLFMLNKWWDGEHIPYGKGGDQKPLGDFLKVNKDYEKYWHHFSEREMNCYPTNSYPYDYIVHFMGVKSKIDIKNRLRIWNNYVKKENDDLKIYISLTTTKERIEVLPFYVKNLLKNKVKPNKIVITVTTDCDVTKINDLLKEFITKKIVFIHTEKNDYGSLLGYIGISNFIKNNDLLSKENFGVIVLSDKLFYKNYIVEEYKKNSILNPRSILTLYHMSALKISIANGLGGSYILKDADSIFLPKYYFIQDRNPSLQETISEITKKYNYHNFTHHDIFTVFCYYKNMEKKSINEDRRVCYNNIRSSDIDNITINSSNEKHSNKTKEIVNNFEKYYLHEKYSNVKFIHHVEIYNNIVTCQKGTINYMWNFKPNERKQIPNNVITHNKQFYENSNIVNPKDIEELLNLNEFEDLKQLYNLLPHWVSKADLGRLLYIYYNGGFYIDADCFINRQIELNDKNAVVFVEKKVKSIDMVSSDESKLNPDNVSRMANFCFGTTIKKHPFFKDVINECLKRIKFRYIEKGSNHLTKNNYDEKTLRQKEILWVCGPDVITCVYHNVKHSYKDILSLNSDYLQHNIEHSWW